MMALNILLTLALLVQATSSNMYVTDVAYERYTCKLPYVVEIEFEKIDQSRTFTRTYITRYSCLYMSGYQIFKTSNVVECQRLAANEKYNSFIIDEIEYNCMAFNYHAFPNQSQLLLGIGGQQTEECDPFYNGPPSSATYSEFGPRQIFVPSCVPIYMANVPLKPFNHKDFTITNFNWWYEYDNRVLRVNLDFQGNLCAFTFELEVTYGDNSVIYSTIPDTVAKPYMSLTFALADRCLQYDSIFRMKNLDGNVVYTQVHPGAPMQPMPDFLTYDWLVDGSSFVLYWFTRGDTCAFRYALKMPSRDVEVFDQIQNNGEKLYEEFPCLEAGEEIVLELIHYRDGSVLNTAVMRYDDVVVNAVNWMHPYHDDETTVQYVTSGNICYYEAKLTLFNTTTINATVDITKSLNPIKFKVRYSFDLPNECYIHRSVFELTNADGDVLATETYQDAPSSAELDYIDWYNDGREITYYIGTEGDYCGFTYRITYPNNSITEKGFVLDNFYRLDDTSFRCLQPDEEIKVDILDWDGDVIDSRNLTHNDIGSSSSCTYNGYVLNCDIDHHGNYCFATMVYLKYDIWGVTEVEGSVCMDGTGNVEHNLNGEISGDPGFVLGSVDVHYVFGDNSIVTSENDVELWYV